MQNVYSCRKKWTVLCFFHCLLKCGWCLVFFKGLYSILLGLSTYFKSQPAIIEYLNDLRTEVYCHIALFLFKRFETHGANVTGWPPNAIKRIEMKSLIYFSHPLSWVSFPLLPCNKCSDFIPRARRLKSSCSSERSFSFVQQRMSGLRINNQNTQFHEE